MTSLQGEVRKCAQESVQGTKFFDPTQTSDVLFLSFYSTRKQRKKRLTEDQKLTISGDVGGSLLNRSTD